VYGKRYEYLQEIYDKLCKDIDNEQSSIDKENAYITLWRDYKDRIVRVLENGIAKANADKKRRGTISATVKTDRPLDIFQAILNSDSSHFKNCFTKGVSLNDFNPEGYSPLTYAVKTGQNDMVQFFIDHNADLSAYDKRGYNAIQTAVENNYKDICQMLLNYDRSLARTRSRSGEDLMTIARKNTFENWLSKNI
jgi:ankyrin repeat protein